jgi:putative transposase
VEALLAELEPLLYGYNYQVFLRVYRVPFAPGEPAAWYVTQVLGPSAVVTGSVPVTHSMRFHAHHNTFGMGHVYQGRFKSFPIERDEHLLAVLRYVERNPLRAKLVKRADAWRWGSLYRRLHGTAEERALLTDSPVPLGRNWLAQVHRPQTMAELLDIRQSVLRGRPYGNAAWQQKTAARMGLEFTFRPRGRPRKHPEA